MSAEITQVPTPPDGVRPGQLGVVMIGRVIIGDLAATLADLSIRKLLRVESPSGGGWLLTPLLASAPRHRGESALAYEQTLLEGLAGHGKPVSLSELASTLPAVLDRTRTELVHDAVHRGWLRHLHHDQRTPAGEELARHVRAFQRDLRHLKAQGNADALAGPLLPYALHFGIAEPDRSPLARFAQAFASTFAGLPGWQPPAPQRPSLDNPDVIAKPSIDEQIMSPEVSMGVWLTGW